LEENSVLPKSEDAYEAQWAGLVRAVFIIGFLLIAFVISMAFVKYAHAQTIGTAYRQTQVGEQVDQVNTTTTITQDGRKLSLAFAFTGSVRTKASLMFAAKVERKRKNSGRWKLYKSIGGGPSFSGPGPVNGTGTPPALTLPKGYHYRLSVLVALLEGKSRYHKAFKRPLLPTTATTRAYATEAQTHSLARCNDDFTLESVQVAANCEQDGEKVTVAANFTGFVVTPATVSFTATLQRRQQGSTRWVTYKRWTKNSDFIAEPVNLSLKHTYRVSDGSENRLKIEVRLEMQDSPTEKQGVVWSLATA
jgi:hypothetical protein